MKPRLSPFLALQRMRQAAVFRLIACFSLLSFPATWGPWAIPAAQANQDDELQAFIQQFQAMVADAESRLSQLSGTAYTTQDWLDSLNRDLPSVIQWSAEHLRWTPYQGHLRGSDAMMLDRSGNSLDLSLFLAKALISCGIEARIVETPFRGPWMVRLSKEAELKIADQPTLAPDSIRSWRDPLAKASEESETRLKGFLETLQNRPTPALPERTLYAVEYLEKDGSWQRAYPGFGAKPMSEIIGTTFRPVAWELTPPDSMLHRLEIQVTAVRVEGAKVSEHALVGLKMPASEAGNRQITIAFQPVNQLKQDQLLEQMMHDPEGAEVAYIQSQVNERSWIPFITVEDRKNPIYEWEVNQQGQLTKPGEPMAGLGRSVGGAAGLFGGLGAIGGEPAPTPGRSILAAIHIDYRIHAPGQKPTTERRTVFDVRDAIRADGNLAEDGSIQRAWAFTRQVSLLPQNGRVPDGYAEWSQLRRIVVAKPYFEQLIKTSLSGSEKELTKNLTEIQSRITYRESALWGIAAARLQDDSLYIPRLNLFSIVNEGRPGPQGEGIWESHGIDIISNGVASLKGNPRERWHAVFASGVWDTTLEHQIISASAGGAAQPSAFSVLMNPATSWKLLAGPQPDYHTDIQSDLKQGYAVLALASDGHPTHWWRIHPETGETLGMGYTEFGLGGSATTEYLNLLNYALTVGFGLRGLTKCMAGASGGGAKGLGCALCFLVAITIGKIALVSSHAAVGVAGTATGGLCGEL